MELPATQQGVVQEMFSTADAVSVGLADTHMRCCSAQVEPREVAVVGGG